MPFQLSLPGLSAPATPASASHMSASLLHYPDVSSDVLCENAKTLGHAAELFVDSVFARLGVDPFILQNNDSGGNTIIEALEQQIYEQAAFGIVLMTPDDYGYAKAMRERMERGGTTSSSTRQGRASRTASHGWRTAWRGCTTPRMRRFSIP